MKNYIRINTGFSKIDYVVCATCFVLVALIAFFSTTKILTYYSLDWIYVYNCVFILLFTVYVIWYFYVTIKYFHANCDTKYIDINHDEIVFYNKNENIEKIVIKQNNIKKFLLIHNGRDVQIKIETENQIFNFYFPTTYYDCFSSFVAEKIQNLSPYINNFEYLANSQLCKPRINKFNINSVTILIIFCSICFAYLLYIFYPSEKYKDLIITNDLNTSYKIADYLISKDYNVLVKNDKKYFLQVKNTAKKDWYTALMILWENDFLNADVHLVKGFNLKSFIKHNVSGVKKIDYKVLNKENSDENEVLINLLVENNTDLDRIKMQITNLFLASIENLKSTNIKYDIKIIDD